MKTFIRNAIIAAAFMLGTVSSMTATQKPEIQIDTEYSTTRVIRETTNKTITGDVLVYGNVVQIKKQIGVDNVKIIRREGVYNCARNEFVIKDVTAFDRDGEAMSSPGIKTNVILTPDMDIVKREFKFLCEDVKVNKP